MASDAASLGGAAGQQSVPSRPRTKVGDPHDEADAKPSYKSWKKKYRKMRVAFDEQMTECEDLYRKEVKAKALVKRLAIENDRILDLLLDNNSSSQIPPNRRINLGLPPSADSKEHADLQVDQPARPPGTPTKTSLSRLLAEVPHSSYADTVKSLPSFAQDMEPLDGDAHPLSFLSADDIDNYIYEIDRRLDAENMLPTLAPAARIDKTTSANGGATPSAGAANGASANSIAITTPAAAAAAAAAANSALGVAGDFALKNPISVYNWLRKHAPNTFLQDVEAGAGDDGETDGRKARGAAKPERVAKGGSRSKRTSLAAKTSDSKATEAWDVDDDPEFSATPSTARGKRKRDDDGGYRPKSGARPTKKKRKSDGDAMPSASRRTKKEPKDD